jgi:uncharacterized membrane protein
VKTDAANQSHGNDGPLLKFMPFHVNRPTSAASHKHLMHTVIAFSAVPLFLGALLSDWAYTGSYQVQWVNFAAWLTAGGLLLAGPALLWGAIDLLRSRATRNSNTATYLVLLLATCVVGFSNSLIHAKDGWAAMPTGLILSAVVALLAVMASAAGLRSFLRRTA